MWTPDGVKALASLVTAVFWPLLALAAMLMFAPQLRDLLSRLSDFEAFGLKAKVAEKVQESAEAAQRTDEPDNGPTTDDLRRAIQVETLASKAPQAFVRQEAESLAAEYERVRASMPGSNKRTRAMEVVVAKMRAFGRAALPLRYELAASPSPGHRLQAIISLQLQPDFELVEWLGERAAKEVPFVAFHALVALNRAVSDSMASEHLRILERALEITRTARPSFGRDTSRIQQFEAFQQGVVALGEEDQPKNEAI